MAAISWRGAVRGALLGALALAGGGISVAHADARPPFAPQGSKLTASAQIGNGNLGWSVALSADGNTALVGSPSENSGFGAAWVFTRSGSSWTQQAKLAMPIGETTHAVFGGAVALSADGNTALIGGQQDGDPNWVGAAWVFVRSGSDWTQQGSKLQGSDRAGDGQFGAAVALSADGNTAAIGAPVDTTSGGAGWIFTRSGSAWTQQGLKLTGAGALGSAHFGRGVALSGDGSTVLFGGPSDNGYAGAAWGFTRSMPSWTPQGGKLVPTDAVGGPEFGVSPSLSADGNTALIGGGRDGYPNPVGAAWVFTRSGGVWTQGPKLRPSDEVGNGWFGTTGALSSDGNTALIGAYLDNSQTGAAWAFTRSGSSWTQQTATKLTGSDATTNAAFGYSVALSANGDTALMGGYNDNGGKGAAWVFSSPLSPPPAVGPPPAGQGPGPPGSLPGMVFPLTTITSGPNGFTASVPTFTFTAFFAGATFECQFDGAPYTACTTPLTRYGLAYGPHTFHVRSVSPAGVRDPNPDSRQFTLGETTSEGTCTVLIPWAYASDRDWLWHQPRCTPVTVACPEGSRCKIALTATVSDADERMAWGVMGVDTFVRNGLRIGVERGLPLFCDSSSYKDWFTRFDGRSDFNACPVRETVDVFGPADSRVFCDAIPYQESQSNPVRGPDDQRQITCHASFKVQPAVPLNILALDGSTLAVVAPGPGALGLSAAGGGKPHQAAAAAAVRRRKPAPAIAPVRVSVPRAGAVTIKLKLSKPAATTLRRRGRLPLRLRLRFTPVGGSATESTQSVTLTRAACRPRQPGLRRPRRRAGCPVRG